VDFVTDGDAADLLHARRELDLSGGWEAARSADAGKGIFGVSVR
jgi:allantoicase